MCRPSHVHVHVHVCVCRVGTVHPSGTGGSSVAASVTPAASKPAYRSRSTRCSSCHACTTARSAPHATVNAPGPRPRSAMSPCVKVVSQARLRCTECLSRMLQALQPHQQKKPPSCLLGLRHLATSAVRIKGATRQRGLKLRLRDLGKIWVSGVGPWEPAAASSTLRYRRAAPVTFWANGSVGKKERTTRLRDDFS